MDDKECVGKQNLRHVELGKQRFHYQRRIGLKLENLQILFLSDKKSRAQTTALWPMEQSSILSVQWPTRISASATARDCETGLFVTLAATDHNSRGAFPLNGV